jgi:GxxExxY protein
LQKNGYKVQQQLIIPVIYDNLSIDVDLRLDLLVNDCIILELKAIEHMLPVHEAQLLTYMKLLRMPQGLLINLFTDNITRTMKPFVNEYFSALPDE